MNRERTWIEPESFTYPSGALRSSARRARAMCSDGVIRACVAGIADTAFSIPARVKVKGKTVSGFLMQADWLQEERSIYPGVKEGDLIFCAYSYGKNANVLPERSLVGSREGETK